jgi:hypothetical protein
MGRTHDKAPDATGTPRPGAQPERADRRRALLIALAALVVLSALAVAHRATGKREALRR